MYHENHEIGKLGDAYERKMPKMYDARNKDMNVNAHAALVTIKM